uniref:snRNA-activating protein complex subunit n=1 Tax=Oryza brachyantha TaxID=4533 RepID=J3L713_ORYBR
MAAAAGEEAESSAAGEQRRVPFARGGPVFVPFMVGPVSTVPEFMSSALRELQLLKDELGDPGDEFDEELCVDELRVLSEEELVERALREAMECWDSAALSQLEDQMLDAGMSAGSTLGDGAITSSSSGERESSGSPNKDMPIVPHVPQGNNGKTGGGRGQTKGRKGKNATVTLDPSVETERPGPSVDMAVVACVPQQGTEGKTGGMKGKPRGRKRKGVNTTSNSLGENVSVPPVKDLEFVSHDPASTEGHTKCVKGKKRGRHFDREVRAHILQGSYLTKAVKMAEIKAKQEDDKRAARLHSFSGDSVLVKGSKPSSEKVDVAKSLRYTNTTWKNKTFKAEEHRPVVYPEVLVCVEVYEKRYGSVKSQEFLVLGSQLLTDLRDNIYCFTDKLMNVAKQHVRSGYFLIEDTFYNDTRHSTVDYSKPILDWLKNSSNEAEEKWDTITSGVLKKRQKDLLLGLNISNVPDFKSAKMEKTRFSDLNFRLGAGYLYCHQGNCKHMIVIRDMRLIHPEDTQNQAEYPLMTFQMQRRLQKCSVCQIYHATKMTVDDKWTQNNPCYFCAKCYYLLHYKEDNSLLYPHTVYDYLQE